MTGQDIAWSLLILGAIWWLGQRASEAIDRYEAMLDQRGRGGYPEYPKQTRCSIDSECLLPDGHAGDCDPQEYD